MSFTRLYSIICDQCGTGFGGPDGGDYDPADHGGTDQGVFAWLVEEGISVGALIKITLSDGEHFLCGPKCLIRFAKGEL